MPPRSPCSKSSWMTALSCGLTASTRAIAASTSSCGEASPERTSSAWAVASMFARFSRYGHRFTPFQRTFSSPTVNGWPSSPTRRTASSTPGMNELRSIESWRIAERLPLASEQHLLVGDQARQPNRVDRLVDVAARLGDQLRGALRRARGRVELAVVMELDDLDLGHVPRGLGGEAHHQHRADREVGRDEARSPSRPPRGPAQRPSGPRRRRSPMVPTTACTPASRQARMLSSAVAGVVKSTTTSASPRRARRARCRAAGPRARRAPGPRRPRPPRRPPPPSGPRRRRRRRESRDEGLRDVRGSGAEAVLVGADAGGGEARPGRRARRPAPRPRRS